MGSEELTLRCAENNLEFTGLRYFIIRTSNLTSVTWLKNDVHYIPDGNRVHAQGGLLVFDELLVSDEGNWTCTNGSRATDRSPEFQLYG